MRITPHDEQLTRLVQLPLKRSSWVVIAST